MDDNSYYMRLALDEARLALPSDIPVGAVLVAGGQVIAKAHNMKEALNDPTAHAEILALRQGAASLGRWRLTGSVLYVTKEPCPMCAGAIVNSRIDTLVFGCPDAKGGGAGSLYEIPADSRLNHRAKIIKGVLEEECVRLLKGFFEGKRAASSKQAI
ncbi:MAG: tRNA adenosine(34) deaminase TadA [Actinomycetota bacterium]|nr:tRNA adenosine(34) deaminase TadA [Actinomycetota bacterium]